MPSTKSQSTVEEKQPASGVTQIGVVETDQRDKTRKVVVRFLVKHPKYGKFIRRRTVLHVHDAKNESHVGDTVEVAPTRPISKTKSWKLLRVLEKSTRIEV
jgi:small subunit ribosomal protein S17